MGLGDTFAFYTYVSDNGNSYNVKLSAAVAAAGSFGAASLSPLSLPEWPFHEKNMRHVWGNDGAGHRARLAVSHNNNALYTGGGTFSLHGRNYGVQGAIGEKRKLNSVG